MAAKNSGFPPVDLLRTHGQALVRPIPCAFHRRGFRRPRAALRNPTPRRPTLACQYGTRPDRSLARASPDGACAPALRPSQPVRRPRVPRPLRPAPPSSPDPSVPCGTFATPTVGLDPRTNADPSTPSPRAGVTGPSRRTDDRHGGPGVAATRPICTGLPATAPEIFRTPVLPAPSPFRGWLLPVDRVPAMDASGKDRDCFVSPRSRLPARRVSKGRPANNRNRRAAGRMLLIEVRLDHNRRTAHPQLCPQIPHRDFLAAAVSASRSKANPPIDDSGCRV